MAAAQESVVTNYADFWPFYLRQHSKPQTRRLHYIGTALTLLILGYALLNSKSTYLLLIPFAGESGTPSNYVTFLCVLYQAPETAASRSATLCPHFRACRLWLRLGRALCGGGQQASDLQVPAVEPGERLQDVLPVAVRAPGPAAQGGGSASGRQAAVTPGAARSARGGPYFSYDSCD